MTAKTQEKINRMFELIEANSYKEGQKKGELIFGSKPKIAKELEISVDTLDRWMKDEKNPIQRIAADSNVEPVYITDFINGQSYKRFKDWKVKNAPGKYEQYLSDFEMMYRALKDLHGRGKDPSTWDEKDYRYLWDLDRFKNEDQKGNRKLAEAKSVSIRNVMKFFNPSLFQRLDLTGEISTKPIAEAHGKKLNEWISREEDIITVIKNINFPDTLFIFFLGLQCGGRHSSFYDMNYSMVNIGAKQIVAYERKVDMNVIRLFSDRTMDQLWQYILDNDMGDPNARLFPRNLASINEDLRQAGHAAKLHFELTSHKIKHTFASFGPLHGLSMDTVSSLTGTDITTLKQFYSASNPAKVRAEILGGDIPKPDFHLVIERLQPIVTIQYQRIKDAFRSKSYKSKQQTLEKMHKERKIVWGSFAANIRKFEDTTLAQYIKQAVGKPKKRGGTITERDARIYYNAWTNTIRFQKQALQYHDQGYSDKEAEFKAKEDVKNGIV